MFPVDKSISSLPVQASVPGNLEPVGVTYDAVYEHRVRQRGREAARGTCCRNYGGVDRCCVALVACTHDTINIINIVNSMP